jgi:hypothetical protein
MSAVGIETFRVLIILTENFGIVYVKDQKVLEKRPGAV